MLESLANAQHHQPWNYRGGDIVFQPVSWNLTLSLSLTPLQMLTKKIIDYEQKKKLV